jgi:hypothetical protein
MEDNNALSHDEFVRGLAEGMHDVKFVLSSHNLLEGARKRVFVLYIVAPLVVIPVYAYTCGNWWLLFGIVAAGIGAMSPSFVGMFLCICIGVWLRAGAHIHQYVTFFFLCALCECLLFRFCDARADADARKTLIENAPLYEAAIKAGAIALVPTKVGQARTKTA